MILLLPAPSYAGHWAISLKGSTIVPKTVIGNYTFDNSQVTGPAPYSPASSPYFTITGGFPVASCSLGLPGTLSVTATLTWTPDAPGDTSQPPPTVDLLETVNASASQWILQPTGVNVSASDGFGDPVTYATPPGYGASSSGKHLYHMTVSPGQTTMTLPTRTLSASVSYASAITSGTPGAGISYAVQQDTNTREVSISCLAVDTSKYRDPPLTGPIIVNARQPDGTLRGDTLLLSVKSNDQIVSTAQSFAYHANVSGAWAGPGTYHWFSNLTGGSASGSLPPVADFNDTAIPYTTTAGSINHIFLSVYDGTDGAEATGNYYLHLHAQYEPTSWPEDSGSPYKVMGSDPDVPSWPTYPWKNISPLNEGVFPTTSFPVTYKEAGIESVDGGLDLGADPVVLHFGVSGNPTSSFPYANTLTPQPALKPGQETWVVSREIIARHKGHLDIYGVHGYTSTGVWRHDIMQGIDVNLYFPYPMTSTLASDPPAGWNPPGYK